MRTCGAQPVKPAEANRFGEVHASQRGQLKSPYGKEPAPPAYDLVSPYAAQIPPSAPSAGFTPAPPPAGFMAAPPPPGFTPAPAGFTYQQPSTSFADPNAPPPSYDSLYGRVRAAKANLRKDGPVSFSKQIWSMVSNGLCSLCLLTVVLAIPLAMVVIGAQYLGQCPIRPNIPVYLVVGGANIILLVLLLVTIMVKDDITAWVTGKERPQQAEVEEETPAEPVMVQPVITGPALTGQPDAVQTAAAASSSETKEEDMDCCDGIILLVLVLSCLFVFVWFVAGNVWTYGVLTSVQTADPNVTDTYCAHVPYWLSFGLNTTVYALIFLACGCASCLAAA